MSKKASFKVGLGFGLASGVITTLGLMIGLYMSTFSRGIVIAGILTIAVTDAFSDAVGMHFAEETEGIHTTKEIWMSTFYTFFTKFVVAMTFLFPILFFPLITGLFVNIFWSFFLVGVFSYIVAKRQNNHPLKAVFEHYLIMIVVIICTYYLGKIIEGAFING